MSPVITVRVGYIPAPGESPVLDIVEGVSSVEEALQRLRVSWGQVTTTSVRCEFMLDAQTQCSHYVRKEQGPWLCITHKPKRTPEEKGRSWEKNAVYQVYARMHRMTVAERWAADHYNTAPFHAWTRQAAKVFGQVHPDAVAAFNGTITKLDVWHAWLNTLTPAQYWSLVTHG